MLLDVQDLTVNFTIRDGMVHAVENVSLQLEKGKTLGLVGLGFANRRRKARAS